MPMIVTDIFSLLGFLLRAVGFGLVGFGIGKFVLDAYRKADWQLQIALVLGFFGLLVGLTDFASPGSAGAFAAQVSPSSWRRRKTPKHPRPKPKRNK